MHVVLTRGLWLLVALCLVGSSASPAQNEEADYTAAARAFEDELWDRAERELAEFVRKYPGSVRRPLATLLRAQALCHLGRAAEAVELLQAESGRAGPLADAFLFWRGQAEQSRGRHREAAAAYHELLQQFAHSHLRLEAAVNEAVAWAALDQWHHVADLLGQTNGVFQQSARENPQAEVTWRGWLLLAEALWRTGRAENALQLLQELASHHLGHPLALRRLWLEARCLADLDRTAEALQVATNLTALARQTGSAAWEARSRLAHAAILERAGDAGPALSLYGQNLAPHIPAELQEESILKLSRLALARRQHAEATGVLEAFLKGNTNSPVADLALVALGELELDQYLTLAAAGPGAPTNLVARARDRFESVLRAFPQSPLRARAELNRGWCLWLTGRWQEAGEAFREAAVQLQDGPDRAMAWFKLGDVAFRQGRFAEAISNYQAVVALSAQDPMVRTQLCEPALYQTARAAVEQGDLSVAQQAVGRILDEFPNGFLTEAVLTLQAQGLARLGNPASARKIFQDVLTRFPETPHRADLLLAVARTYEFERNWSAAAESYRQWLEQFAGHSLSPEVEFALAWTTYRMGDDAAALAAFTNFLARYTNQPLAVQAQWWLADYYHRSGPSGYVEAERQYQLLAARYPGHPLAYEARMMAGRVAMARQAWLDAIGYFTNLTADLSCPAHVKIQALFAYGDATRRLPPADTNAPLANFEEAARIFAKILEFNPTNATAARAWGEIGECYLQLGGRDPNFYAAASNAFHQALSLPQADVATRSQAWLGLGLVSERLAAMAPPPQRQERLREALDRYVDVLYGRHLRSGEVPDVFWTRRAGLEAARLAETLHEWPQALRLYERLRDLLPPLQPALEKRMERIRERLMASSAES